MNEMNKLELQFDRLYLGNCVDVIRAHIPDNSIDLGVTDPPYGLNFMGKDWDKALPPREAFEELFRVLKPGALAFVMSSPRQDLLWRMLAMLECVGFELTQSYIDWIYKTGFPKTYDISKGIDKTLGLERKIIGKSIHSAKRLSSPNYAGEYKNEPNGRFLSEPKSELGKTWEGWKSQTGLKPAHEPILMVNKPFSESTIVDNVLRWGTGAINVDACRIPYKSNKDYDITAKKNAGNALINRGELFGGYADLAPNWQSGKGRFPANLLVSDKAIDTGEISKSGDLLPHHNLSK